MKARKGREKKCKLPVHPALPITGDLYVQQQLYKNQQKNFTRRTYMKLENEAWCGLKLLVAGQTDSTHQKH